MALRTNLIAAIFVFFALYAKAQVVQSNVKVINRTQNRSFEYQYLTLQRDLSRMINQTRWSSPMGKSKNSTVSLNMTFSIVEHRNEVLKAMLMIEVFRSESNKNKTLLLRWVEQQIVFSYVPSEPLIFNKNMLSSNLLANAAFFTYLALGLNQDSEVLLGGTSFYRQAEDLVARMQSTSNAGWEMRRNGSSKYRLVYELLQEPYFPIRTFLYNLHSKCLVSSQTSVAQDPLCLRESVQQLRKAENDFTNSLLLQRIEESNSAIFNNIR